MLRQNQLMRADVDVLQQQDMPEGEIPNGTKAGV